MQGDVLGVYNESGTLLVSYIYDAWGNFTETVNGTSTEATLASDLPFRYRGYYFDEEINLYYLNTRYYDASIGRFINADDISYLGANGDLQAFNLYAYCSNNPVMGYDPNGNLPKWLTGVLNVVSGALQMVAGFALGVTVGWTGFGTVAAWVLIVNGAATVTQGVGQIVNDIADEEILREDNIIRTDIQSVGHDIAGDTGAEIAGYAYDGIVFASSMYYPISSTIKSLQQAGKIPVRVNINSLIPDPTNPMTDEGINYWTRTLSQNGFKGYNSLPNAYGLVEPICVQRATMMITNGHHRVAVLARYGLETIYVYLVP